MSTIDKLDEVITELASDLEEIEREPKWKLNVAKTILYSVRLLKNQ
jgi:hypothetical protein